MIRTCPCLIYLNIQRSIWHNQTGGEFPNLSLKICQVYFFAGMTHVVNIFVPIFSVSSIRVTQAKQMILWSITLHMLPLLWSIIVHYHIITTKYYLWSIGVLQVIFRSYYFLIISIPTSSKENENDELLYIHGSVTRYGPRTTCQRKGLETNLFTEYQ